RSGTVNPRRSRRGLPWPTRAHRAPSAGAVAAHPVTSAGPSRGAAAVVTAACAAAALVTVGAGQPAHGQSPVVSPAAAPAAAPAARGSDAAVPNATVTKV